MKAYVEMSFSAGFLVRLLACCNSRNSIDRSSSLSKASITLAPDREEVIRHVA